MLPAKHGTQITLSCKPGYNNFGGETADCQDGEFIPTDNPPQCHGIVCMRIKKVTLLLTKILEFTINVENTVIQ
jgi:hypothetical protein